MDDLEIIEPPQYSFAWLILAVLCVLIILTLVILTVRLTRYILERRAYRGRPDEAEGLKAEFLRMINGAGERHDRGEVTARDAHRELEAIMRMFVTRTVGLDVRTQDAATLEADPRTRQVGRLIADIHVPGYARTSDAALHASMQRARAVVRAWS